MITNLDKTITLVSWGMNPEGLENTWAWNNFEQAKALNGFFDSFLSTAKSL